MHEDEAIVRFTSLTGLKREELRELQGLAGPLVRYPAGTVLKEFGEVTGDPLLLLEGWACSSVPMEEGARQIVKIHLPGDLMGLPNLAYTRNVDTIMSLTEIAVRIMPRSSFGTMFERYPRMAAALFLISLEERVTLMERLCFMGRAEAARRLAALIVQIRDRLLKSDPDLGLTFRIPLTQSHVADMIGTSANHVSRVIQDLSSRGLIKWGRGKLTVLDMPGLLDLAALPPRDVAHDTAWLPRPFFSSEAN